MKNLEISEWMQCAQWETTYRRFRHADLTRNIPEELPNSFSTRSKRIVCVYCTPIGRPGDVVVNLATLEAGGPGFEFP